MSAGNEDNARLFALFTQRNPDGTPRFSKADIRHYMPLIVLSTGIDITGLSDLQRVMSEFVAKLQLPADLDSATFTRMVQTYYRKHPPNPELERQFLAFCRSLARGELDAAKVQTYAKAAGIKLTDQSPMKGMTRPTGGMSLRARR